MNFLAHLYLSGEDEQILLGNYIGDFIKGKSYLQFDTGIQKGILLHRYIDEFTDNHHIAKESKKHVRKKYGKYAGIVIDVFYDHFLAANFNDYSSISLSEFARKRCSSILKNYLKLPGDIQKLIPYIVKNKYIISYVTLKGVERTLKKMSEHTSLPGEVDFGIQQLTDNYEKLLSEFKEFFNDLVNHVTIGWDITLTTPIDAYRVSIK